MCEAVLQDVVYYTSSTMLNLPDSLQDVTLDQSICEPVSQNVLPMPMDSSQDVTTNQNMFEPALPDVTTHNSHDKTSSVDTRPNLLTLQHEKTDSLIDEMASVHKTAQTTSDSNGEPDKSSQEITPLPQSSGDSVLEMDTSENTPDKNTRRSCILSKLGKHVYCHQIQGLEG